MKKIVFVVIALTITTAANAQTKRVAHRSHSGTNATFTTHGNDNFGLATPVEPGTTKTDSNNVKKTNTPSEKAGTRKKASKKKATSKKYSGSTK